MIETNVEKKPISKLVWFGLILGSILTVTIAFITYLINNKNKNVNPLLYAKENRIVFSLPYDVKDEPIGLVPMGETIYHPISGHGGIDIGWDHNAPVRASADGKIIFINESPGKNKVLFDIVIESGQYYIDYGGLQSKVDGIAIGSIVKQHDIIGYPEIKDGPNYAIHWDIRPAYENSTQLCPLTYLDSISRQKLEEIWAKTKNDKWEYLNQFPEICNGKFKSLNSFQDIVLWMKSDAAKQEAEQMKKFKSGNEE